jgi:predicted nucleic acid-binding protein
MREGRYHGLRTAANKEQLLRAWQLLQETEIFLSQFVILPVDEAAAAVFDRLVNMKLGKIGRSDLLIASIVLSHNAILVTHNVKDSQRVPNLTIEDWIARRIGRSQTQNKSGNMQVCSRTFVRAPCNATGGSGAGQLRGQRGHRQGGHSDGEP